MEERLARLEIHAEHIQSDVTELKAQVTRLDTKIDAVNANLGARIDAVNAGLGARIESLKDWAVGIAILLLTASLGGIVWLSQRQDALVAEVIAKALAATPSAPISPKRSMAPHRTP